MKFTTQIKQELIEIFRWVNNQDFQRASPEPPLPETQGDLFHKFLQPQNAALHAMQILQPHHLLHKVSQFFYRSN